MSVPDGIVYTRVTPAHVPQICEIERLSFDAPWSHESFIREMDDSLARYFAALTPSPDGGGEPYRLIGYGGYWSVAGEAHVTNIAVHPEYRGMGVGGGILRAMMLDAERLRHSSATLEVRVDNDAAIHLYEKFGFERAGVRKNYYEHEKKDALIMWKKFIY